MTVTMIAGTAGEDADLVDLLLSLLVQYQTGVDEKSKRTAAASSLCPGV